MSIIMISGFVGFQYRNLSGLNSFSISFKTLEVRSNMSSFSELLIINGGANITDSPIGLKIKPFFCAARTTCSAISNSSGNGLFRYILKDELLVTKGKKGRFSLVFQGRTEGLD